MQKNKKSGMEYTNYNNSKDNKNYDNQLVSNPQKTTAVKPDFCLSSASEAFNGVYFARSF